MHIGKSWPAPPVGWIFIFSILFASLIVTQAVFASTLEQFAEDKAKKLFGSGSTAIQITSFYDAYGNEANHLFLVRKNPTIEFNDYLQKLEEGHQLVSEGESLLLDGFAEEGHMLINEGSTLVHQENKYGAILVSPDFGNYSVVAFHHGLPTYITYQDKARELSEKFYQETGATFLGILYLSPLEYFFEFQKEDQNILVNPFKSEVINKEDFDFPPLETSNYSTITLSNQDKSITKSLTGLSGEMYGAAAGGDTYPTSALITGVPDYNQPYSLPNSCAPTAGANLLLYWDAQGFQDFIVSPEDQATVPNLIEELGAYMNWDPIIGVYYEKMQQGLQDIVLDKNYGMIDVRSYVAITSMDIIKEEIGNGHPLIYGSQSNPWGTGHFVVVVGYQDDFIVVHDNWASTPKDYYVSWNSINHTDDMVTLFMPDNYYAGTPPGSPLYAGSSNTSSNVSSGGGGGCFIGASKTELLFDLYELVSSKMRKLMLD